MSNIKDKEILIVSPNNLGDGSDYVLEEIAIECSKRFAKIHIVYLKELNGKGWLNMPSNCTCSCLNATSYMQGIAKLFFYLCFINKNKFYLTMSSNVHINAALGVARFLKLFTTKYLVARESTVIFKRFNKFKQILYKVRYNIGYPFIDLVICQTNGMKVSLIENIKWLKNNCVVIHNPLDAEKITIQANQPNPNIQNYTPYILAVGRLIAEKQFDLLIRAFALLQNFEYKLIIVGNGTEDNNLQLLINELKLNDKVILHGYEKNPYPFMKAASLCVLSSRHEGFPNALLQMLVLNEHCISTNCCDIINEIPALTVVKRANVNDLSRAMKNALKQNNFNEIELQNKLTFLNQLHPSHFVNTLLANLTIND